MEQLQFPFEELGNFYFYYFFYKNMYKNIKGMSAVEGLPGHGRAMKARFDNLEQDRRELEAKLSKIGFDYISIRKDMKAEYKIQGMAAGFEYVFIRL